MRTYLRLFMGVYLIGVAFADLSTGRFDSVNLSYGKTNVSDVGVFSVLGHGICLYIQVRIVV